MEKGAISSYSLAYDRSRLWMTMRAASEEDVLKLVATFPLLRWMDIEVDQLMFRNTGASVMPPVSMN
jgi:muconolactone delta-isomerase